MHLTLLTLLVLSVYTENTLLNALYRLNLYNTYLFILAVMVYGLHFTS